MASICPSFKWSGCPVFKWHSKTRPFDICPLFNHSNTKIARYSDPHCTLFSQLSFFAAYLKHAQHWWRGALWAVRQDGQEQVVPQAAQGHTPRGPPPKVQERKWVWGQTDGVWQWGGRDWLSACHATMSRWKKTLAGGGSRSTHPTKTDSDTSLLSESKNLTTVTVRFPGTFNSRELIWKWFKCSFFIIQNCFKQKQFYETTQLSGQSQHLVWIWICMPGSRFVTVFLGRPLKVKKNALVISNQIKFLFVLILSYYCLNIIFWQTKNQFELKTTIWRLKNWEINGH